MTTRHKAAIAKAATPSPGQLVKSQSAPLESQEPIQSPPEMLTMKDLQTALTAALSSVNDRLDKLEDKLEEKMAEQKKDFKAMSEAYNSEMREDIVEAIKGVWDYTIGVEEKLENVEQQVEEKLEEIRSDVQDQAIMTQYYQMQLAVRIRGFREISNENQDKRLAVMMGMGDQFTNSISAIYQKQTGQIIVNGQLTDSFNIEKGTRQGCPLSPLLFVLTLEVLLNRIRASDELKGVQIRQHDYRLCAFADDLLVTLTQPIQSAQSLMEIIRNYGRVSGFKLNISKTKMLVKNLDNKSKQDLERITGCEIVKKVKYLGIYIEASNGKLYKNNYEFLWNKVQKELENWKKLQLSMLGRIAAIKMNVLPKFLFLFQMLPILKKDGNLDEWQKGINKFIWDGKKPRVKLKIIQDTRERGGLKMPNFKLYYYAAVLVAISDWINLTNERILNIEGYGLVYGFHAYLVYDKKLDRSFKEHILRNSMLRVWKKYYYKLCGKIPLWTVPRHAIQSVGIQQIQDVVPYDKLLIKEGNSLELKSLDRLKEEGIAHNWYYHAQLQARWQKDVKMGFSLKDEKLIIQVRDQRVMHIKRIYDALIEVDSGTELVKDCMTKWEGNFGHPIMMETWKRIWVKNVKFTQAQHLRENFYKMFYRWHLDPKKLSLMYPNMQPKCWRCDSMDATYFHIWWTCKKIKAFWIKIWWILQNILKKRIEFLPQLFLLGITKDCTTIETKLILNLITAARLLVGQYWKTSEIPSIEEWTLKVTHLVEMAKISAYLKNHSNETFLRDWKKWIVYMQKKYQLKELDLIYR